MSHLLKAMNLTRDRNISVLIPGGHFGILLFFIKYCKIHVEYRYICSYLLTTIL